MRILYFIILLILSFSSNVFSETKSNFGHQLSEIDLKKKLPDSFVVEHFKSKPSQHFSWFIRKITRYPDYYSIIVTEVHIVGSVKTLYTFTNDGELIDSKRLSDISDSDGSAYNWTEYEYLKDNLILRKSIGLDSGYKPTTLTKYQLEFYEIHNGRILRTNGYLHPETGGYRFFPEISKYKLEAKAIKTFKKNELRLMRNEIFAYHGYIFKS